MLAAVLEALFAAGFVERRSLGRAVAVTPAGAVGLRAALGLDVAAVGPRARERPQLRRVAYAG